MSTFQQGETVVVTAVFTSDAGVETDPSSSITVTIDDSAAAEKVAAGEMTKSSTGRYYYRYLLAADAAVGTWNYGVTATSGAIVTIEEGTFTVAARTT